MTEVLMKKKIGRYLAGNRYEMKSALADLFVKKVKAAEFVTDKKKTVAKAKKGSSEKTPVKAVDSEFADMFIEGLEDNEKASPESKSYLTREMKAE